MMERVERIELSRKPWQGFRLPLHHTRIEPPLGGLTTLVRINVSRFQQHKRCRLFTVVRVLGVEPRLLVSRTNRLPHASYPVNSL